MENKKMENPKQYCFEENKEMENKNGKQTTQQKSLLIYK